jgi:hypothetical protein
MIIEACDGMCGVTNQKAHLFGLVIERNPYQPTMPIAGYRVRLQPDESQVTTGPNTSRVTINTGDGEVSRPKQKKLCKECLKKYADQLLAEITGQTTDKVEPPLLEAM